MNALDVLRFVIAATGFRLTASEKALADLDALVQAADDVVRGDIGLTGRSDIESLAAALARVKGEGT